MPIGDGKLFHLINLVQYRRTLLHPDNGTVHALQQYSQAHFGLTVSIVD